jgi:hypothetical protein
METGAGTVHGESAMADMGEHKIERDWYAWSLANWPSWLIVLLGVWEIVAPWVLGYSDVTPILVNDIIAGAFIAITGLAQAFTWWNWPIWWTAMAGFWLLLAPFALTYQGIAPQAAINDLVVGALAVLFAVIAGLYRPGWSLRGLPPEEAE